MIAQSFEITGHVHFKVNKLLDGEFFIVGSAAWWLRVRLVIIRWEIRPVSGKTYIIDYF